MMQPAEHGLRDDSKADWQPVTVCEFRRLLRQIWDARSQARMWASAVVVRHPIRHDGPEMPFMMVYASMKAKMMRE